MPLLDFNRSFQSLGLLLLCSGLGVACGGQPPQMMAPAAVPVRTQLLQPGTLEDSSEFIGALEAEQRVDLKPEVAGRITQVFVASGSVVRPGQPIIQLRPDQAEAEVAGARAGAEAALFARDAAQAQVESAQANIARTRSEVQLAEAEFSRTQQLAVSGALSQRDLDNARSALEVARAAQKEADENLRGAQARLQQANANFSQAQAQINVNQETLGLKQVAAPVGGLLGDMTLRIGDFVNAGQTITTIVQNQELFLRIQVPTTRANQLRTGLPVELIDPDTGTSLSTGSISFISPDVNTNLQTVLVKARFPNEAGNLRDGQFVRARVIWNTTTALLVPTVAISRVAGQSFVFVAESQAAENGQTQQVAAQRPVQLGAIQGNNYQVLDGLKAGDRVVISNILKLQDGVPIESDTQASSSLF